MELQNIAAERACLAGIIKGGYNTFIEVDFLKPEDFSQQSSNAAFRCIKAAFEKSTNKLDLTTIFSTAHEIGLSNFFAEKSAQAYLRSLASLDVSVENSINEAKKVKKLSIARQLDLKLIEARKDLCKISGAESLSSILNIPEKRVSELNIIDEENNKTEKLGVGSEKWFQNILDNPNKPVGIPTGFGIYDRVIGGCLRNGGVNLIAARLKTGKSFCVDNVGVHVAGNLDIPTLNLDTEMNKEDHFARVSAYLAGVNLTNIEQGKLTKIEIEKVKEALRKLNKMPYYYRGIAGLAFEDILLIIKRWLHKDVGITGQLAKPCLIIYDYFKLMDQDALQLGQEYQMLGFQMTRLTDYAKRYQFPVLAFAQTNRDGATEDTVETLAGSDRLGWFASSISLFKKKSIEEVAQDGIENGNRKLIPLACRYGEGMDFGDYINMNARFDIGRIFELNTRNQVYRKRKEEEKQIQTKEEVEF